MFGKTIKNIASDKTTLQQEKTTHMVNTFCTHYATWGCTMMSSHSLIKDCPIMELPPRIDL